MEKLLSSDQLSRMRDFCRKDLYYLAVILGFNRLYPPLHDQLAREISNLEDRHKLILLPRGVFKTTLGSISFCIWLIIQDQVPMFQLPGRELRILLAKENATLAQHDLASIESLLETNDLFNVLFPDIVPKQTQRTRWNREEMLVNRKSSWPEATITTIGVGGAAQGQHFDVIIFDDIIGDDAKNSDVVMNRTIEWFDYAQSLLISPVNSVIRVYGTRWTKRDVYQHVMDKYPRFKVYSRQIIENGQSIFPAIYPLEVLREMEERNPFHFYSQLCNNPIDPGRCEFRPEWLKTYTVRKGENDELILVPGDGSPEVDLRELDIIGAFDPSIDEKSTSSRRAIVYAGEDPRNRVFVLECYASRDPVDKVLNAIFSLYRRWNPRKFVVESVALSKIYVSLIQREATHRNEWIRVQPHTVSSRMSKDSRIRDAIQQVAAEGRLYCLAQHRELREEFVEFPNSRTKDILDALSMAIQNLTAPPTLEETKEEEKYEEEIQEAKNPVTGY